MSGGRPSHRLVAKTKEGHAIEIAALWPATNKGQAMPGMWNVRLGVTRQGEEAEVEIIVRPKNGAKPFKVTTGKGDPFLTLYTNDASSQGGKGRNADSDEEPEEDEDF